MDDKMDELIHFYQRWYEDALWVKKNYPEELFDEMTYLFYAASNNGVYLVEE